MTAATAPETPEPIWALPSAAAPPDQLKAQISIYADSITLKIYEPEATYVRMISAGDAAQALSGELALETGLLPENTLWWSANHLRNHVALWREPKVWRVALQTAPFQPPERLSIPMPGLIFVCSPATPPAIYAARRRPVGTDEIIYHAPTFNTFRDGRTCPGTHQYPNDISQIPESFFTAFFSMTGNPGGRSKKHPSDLAKLWREMDGAEPYPYHDLEPFGTVADIISPSH